MLVGLWRVLPTPKGGERVLKLVALHAGFQDQCLYQLGYSSRVPAVVGSPKRTDPRRRVGATGGTRTPTAFRPQPPQGCAPAFTPQLHDLLKRKGGESNSQALLRRATRLADEHLAPLQDGPSVVGMAGLEPAPGLRRTGL